MGQSGKGKGEREVMGVARVWYGSVVCCGGAVRCGALGWWWCTLVHGGTWRLHARRLHPNTKYYKIMHFLFTFVYVGFMPSELREMCVVQRRPRTNCRVWVGTAIYQEPGRGYAVTCASEIIFAPFFRRSSEKITSSTSSSQVCLPGNGALHTHLDPLSGWMAESTRVG